MKRLVQLTLLVTLCLASVVTEATAFECGGTLPDSLLAGIRETMRSKSDLTAGVIYITFPGSTPGQPASPAGPPPVVTPAMEEVATEFERFIDWQSNGQAGFEAHILESPNGATRVWTADYPAIMYTPQYVNTIQRYGADWTGMQFAYCGELQSEILRKIVAAYAGELEPNPFVGLDNLVFVPCLEETTPDPLPYGLGMTSIKCSTVPYCDTMCRYSGPTSPVWGCALSWRDNTDYMAGFAHALTHEYGHVIGFGDHKHAGQGIVGPGDQAIPLCNNECGALLDNYFANYDVMFGWIRANHPFNPYIYYDLETIGWLPPAQVITASTRSLVISDLRRGGQMVSVPIHTSESWFDGLLQRWVQSLEFAYHSGVDEDGYIGGDGLPAYPSQGLAVWHACRRQYFWEGQWQTAGGEPMLHDIESAFGLFSDPGEFSDPQSWTIGDTEYGWDNLDTWGSRDPICASRDGYEASQYLGSADDFFSSATQTEFSYRSNPNTFGYDLPLISASRVPMYSPCQTPLVWDYADWGNNPQQVKNSLVISIKEEHPGLSVPYVVVDIELAPREQISSPDAGETFALAGVVPIHWTHDHTIVNRCDIFFSADGGQIYTAIAEDVDADLQAYNWNPASSGVTATSEARIKIRWYNENSAYYEDTETENFAILGQSDSVYLNKSAETGLDYEGSPYSSVGVDYDYNPNGQRNLEDLMVTIASGGPRSVLNRATGLSINQVPEFEDLTLNVFPVLATRPQVGLGGVSVADMDNDGDLDMFCASGTSSTPRLYRNNGNGTYTDVTLTLGLSTLAANSWSGTWADYDRDGWVDLLITRGGDPGVPPESMTGRPAYLIRNKLDPVNLVPTFQDVTSMVGLSTGGANVAASISACWGDVNGDNRLDLYLAEYTEPVSGPRSKLFIQQTNGTFVEEGLSRLPSPTSMLSQAAAQFADMDLDGDLDLVVGTRIVSSGAFVFWNNGSGYFTGQTPLTVPPVGGVSGMKIWDQDLDGRPDLLLTTRDAQQTSHFFHNLQTTSGVVLVDETSHVGLDEGHASDGLTVLDWNRDGDKDVFLGRPVSTGQIFYRAEGLTGTDNPAKNTVAVRLSSPQSVNNRAGIGARVSVQVDGVWRHQWVDGGSGRGGQDDLAQTFAVPSSTGTYPVQVQWPNGWTQSFPATVNRENLDPEVILDETNPTLVNSTVVGSTSYDAQSDKYYWVFSWETEYRSDWSLDSVTVYSSACVPTTTTYTATTFGVKETHGRQTSGRYKHELKVPVDCSSPCIIPYSVSSSHRLGITSTSTQKTFKIMFCPSEG